MKNQRFKPYIYWGVTAVLVIVACVMFAFLLLKIKDVKAAIRLVNGILTPIIYGAVLAYLLTPVYNWTYRQMRKLTEKKLKKEKVHNRIGRLMATTVSLALLLAVVIGLIWLLLPQLISSIMGVVDSLPANVDNFSRWLAQLLKDNPDIEATVMSNYDKGFDMLQKYLNTELMPNLDKVIGGVSSGVISVLVVFKNILIGLIVMVYLLNIKETFATQGKKVIYGVLSVRMANRVIEKIRYTHQVFGGFIIGKLLDSLIIGIICFVCTNFMKMPYALLVSVIIGVTNIIPFFGPFIGAVPATILILLVNPMKALYFVIFVFLLQQFDGNILGPKILGDSTGISSFWVLFSILLFGGVFGFVGMIIGVPTFALIYNLFSEWISYLLSKKELSTDTQDYEDLKYIDEDSKTFIK